MILIMRNIRNIAIYNVELKKTWGWPQKEFKEKEFKKISETFESFQNTLKYREKWYKELYES